MCLGLGFAVLVLERSPLVLRDRFPDRLHLYERMYPHPTASYGGARSGDPHAMGRRIRDLCRQYGIADRMPRPIIPGDKRALNKRVVEALANQCYWMELDNAPGQRVWAYRKAAWAIEDLPVLAGHLCLRPRCRQARGAGCTADPPADGAERVGGHREC